jgi:hypothetical protein
MNEDTPNAPGHKLSQQAIRDQRARDAHVELMKQALLDRRQEFNRLMKQKDSLRLLIAGNLWNVVKAAGERDPGITRAAVLHEAGMGHPYESSKRAPYYFCDPSLDNQEKKKRAKKLAKNPLKYVELAKATARLLHRDDEDAFLLELFQGTPFVAEMQSDIEDPQREIWDTLVSWLQQRTKKISEEFDLRRYFSRQTGWGLNYKDGCFTPGDGQAEEPSAFLGYVEAGYPRRGTFEFTAYDPRDLYGSDCTPEDIATYEDLMRRSGNKVKVDIHSVIVLHLVFAPKGVADAVIPCLRARCVSYLTTADHWDALEHFTGRSLPRGTLIAKCYRAIGTKSSDYATKLPACLIPEEAPIRYRTTANEHEFDISEAEICFSDPYPNIIGLGDTGSVRTNDILPGVPSTLISDSEDDSPHIILPLGEDALRLLSFPISRFMMDQISRDKEVKQSSNEECPILRKIPYGLSYSWLHGDDEERKKVEVISEKLTPFKEGTMLAALLRACRCSDHVGTPMNQLYKSVQDLTTALDKAINDAEAQLDADLRKSL